MEVDYQKLISRSALIALAGYLLSGPVGFLTVHLLKPQPAWISPVIFANNYHFIQDLPYYFGLLLIGGTVMLFVAHYLQCADHSATERFSVLVSLVLTIVFATLILFNYICQTSFVRHLALHYDPANDPAMATFSMANPMSLSWSVEMWGYGLLGVATWLLADCYRNKNDVIRYLLTGNGVISLAGIVLTVVDNSWVLTAAGLIAYILWNVLMIVLMILIYRHARNQVREISTGQ